MMTEREAEILRQALIGPGGRTIVVDGVEFTVIFPPPETQSEIAVDPPDEWLDVLFEELDDKTDSSGRYIN